MLSGTVSDYDFAQPSMQTVLAREADTSTDAVYLTLTAGSVIVEAELYFGTSDGATFAASQLLAGIFASPSALETALNIQFEQDLVGVTASVQQILVAPEYDAAEPSLVGVAVGVGVGAVLVVVCCCVVLCRMGKKTTAAPAPQAVQSATPLQAVQAQTAFVQPHSQVEAAPPMGLPVDGTSYPEAMGLPVADTSYPQVPVAAPTDAGAEAPPLLTMVEIFKRQLGLDSKLNMQDVVDEACVQLGVDATHGNLVEKARECWVRLGPTSGGVP